MRTPRYPQLPCCGGCVELVASRTMVCGGLPQISQGRCIDNVTNVKTLNGLVLWARAAAIAAPDGVDMASAVFGAAGVPALGWHPLYCHSHNTETPSKKIKE